jgi:hypothetical protein
MNDNNKNIRQLLSRYNIEYFIGDGQLYKGYVIVENSALSDLIGAYEDYTYVSNNDYKKMYKLYVNDLSKK